MLIKKYKRHLSEVKVLKGVKLTTQVYEEDAPKCLLFFQALLFGVIFFYYL